VRLRHTSEPRIERSGKYGVLRQLGRDGALSVPRAAAQPFRPLFRAGEPFRVLVAGAAPVGDAFAAQKGDVALHTARHRAPGELAIRLVVTLAVQDVRTQRGGIELRGDGRQALIN